MTSNQINASAVSEEIKHNRISESESIRHNQKMEELEQQQINLQKMNAVVNAATGIAGGVISGVTGIGNLVSKKAVNDINRVIADRNYALGMGNLSLDYEKLQESIRHNVEQESIATRANLISQIRNKQEAENYSKQLDNQLLIANTNAAIESYKAEIAKLQSEQHYQIGLIDQREKQRKNTADIVLDIVNSVSKFLNPLTGLLLSK